MLLYSSGPPCLAVGEVERAVTVHASTPSGLTLHPLADVPSLRVARQQEVSPQQPAPVQTSGRSNSLLLLSTLSHSFTPSIFSVSPCLIFLSLLTNAGVPHFPWVITKQVLGKTVELVMYYKSSHKVKRCGWLWKCSLFSRNLLYCNCNFKTCLRKH